MKRRFRRIAVVAAIPTLVLLVGFLAVRPSNDRDWKPEHARMVEAVFTGDSVRVLGVRHFRNPAPDSVLAGYYDTTVALDDIRTLWFCLAVFDGEGWRGPAHGMLSFGFTGDRYLAISVEARKERGEGYSTWKGMFRKYELIYVVGDERDLVRTRAVDRPDQVYLYPIRAERAKIRELFVSMLERANRLRDRPEFYNTLTNNCTSRLRDHVNEVAPDRIPPTWRTVLPGYADELIRSLGLLDADLGIEEARARFLINERARRHADDPAFSRLVREIPP